MNARAGPLIVIGLGVSLQPLDTSVNVAFPAITAAFDLPLQSIQWVAIAYVLTYAAMVMVCGRLGDLHGHRLVFRLGLAISIVALVLCALADTYGWLLACRVLQGAGTALIMSCGPALAISLYPDAQRARAVGVYGVLFGLGLALGPLIGGFAVEAMGWQGVYWFRVPIAILALLGSVSLPDAMKAGGAGRFDFTGALLLASWMSAILLGLALLQAPGVASLVAACLIVVGLVALALFVGRERVSANPIVRLSLFSSLSFSAINLLNIAVFLVGFAAILLAPYYLTRILGLDVRAMGLVMTLWAGGSMLGAWLAGKLADELSQRMMAFGFGWILCLGQALAALCDGATGLALIGVALLLQGIALGGFQVAYTDTVVATLRPDERGVAGSLAMLTRTLGTVSGAMALAAAFAAMEGNALNAGMTAPAAFLAGFSQVFAWSAAGLALCLLAAMAGARASSAKGEREGIPFRGEP